MKAFAQCESESESLLLNGARGKLRADGLDWAVIRDRQREFNKERTLMTFTKDKSGIISSATPLKPTAAEEGDDAFKATVNTR